MSEPQAQRADPRKVRLGLLAGLAAVTLLVSPPQAAHAEEVNLAAKALEQEQMIASEKQQLEYLLQQADTVRMAELRSQRDQLKHQVVGVQDAISKKITEERANAVGARSSGDKTRADVIEAEAVQLEEQQQEVLRTAARLETNLSRLETLERVRALGAKRTVERNAAEADAGINAALDAFLESMNGGEAVKGGVAAPAARP